MFNETEQLDATLSAVGTTGTYTGAGISVIGGLMLNEVAMIVGMVVGVLGLLVNTYFKQRMTDAHIAALEAQTRREQEAHDEMMRDYYEKRTHASTQG